MNKLNERLMELKENHIIKKPDFTQGRIVGEIRGILFTQEEILKIVDETEQELFSEFSKKENDIIHEKIEELRKKIKGDD